jgi:hypothetical protein
VVTGTKVGRWAALVVAILLLNASLTFENVWPTPFVRWGGRLSVELAVSVLLLAARGARVGRVSNTLLRALAMGWVVLVVGHYANTTAPALYGREVNLFWDLRHLSAVTAMLAQSASGGLVLAGVAGVVLTLLALFTGALWALGVVATAATERWPRLGLVAGSAACLAVFAAQQAGTLTALVPGFAPPASGVYGRQARILVTQLTARNTPAVASWPSTTSDLSGVRGADVYLVFVESYGAVTFDRPAFLAQLAPARAGFETDARESGRQIVSAFVDSPTFGGSSWLAHVTLMTGVETRDEDTNVALMAQERETLVTTFARRGYRTVALMPGLQQSWPEGAFYRFDRIYDEVTLDYGGPSFGWWTVPDQFALARLDSLEASSGVDAATPRFVFFPTTSTHAPFTPTAPYQPDWRRLLSQDPYEAADVDRAWDLTPDYLDLAPAYVRAMTYAYASIGGYLRHRADRDVVFVVLGDHQPAAAVTGEGATWEVPVHVITSRPAILDALRARGFRDGLTPHRPRLGPMQGLLPTLLGAFGGDPRVAPRAADATISSNRPVRR